MTISDNLREIYTRLKILTEKVQDLESEHGEVHGLHFGNRFPSSPYPNQIVVRTDETPPEGGVTYRYDISSNTWLIL